MSVIGLGKYPKSARKVISIIAVLALLIALLPAVPAWAAPVTNVSAQATDNRAGATNVTYDLSFTAPSGLGGGDEITVTFATGYSIVESVARGGTKIAYDNKEYTPAYVSVSGTAVKIGVPAELTVGANGAVEVSIPGVTNPQKAGSYSIAVRTTNDRAGTTTFTIVANVANKIALDAPEEAVANQVVPLTVTIQDEYGNPTTMETDLTVTFTLGPEDTSATLYSDSAATQALTDNELVIAKGNTSGTAYLKNTEAEQVEITASATIGTQSVQAVKNITINECGDLAKIAFTAAPTQITAGEAGTFTLQLQDAYGNAVPADEELTVILTASGVGADTVTWGSGARQDEQDNLKATGTISEGDDTLEFTFRSTQAAERVTITATVADTELSAKAIFRVVPAENHHFVIDVEDAYPAREEIEINSGQRARVTIQVQDTFNNPVPQETNLEVNLSTTSDTGNAAFYAAATGGEPLESVVIPAGEHSVTVYYYDELRPEDGVQKSITISASAGTVTGSAIVTLMGPRPEKFEIAGDDSVEVNLRLPLTIKLLDQYGNSYAVAQPTTVSLTDDKGGEFYTSLVGGTKVDSVTIPKDANEATVYYRPTSVGANTVKATADVAVGMTSFKVEGSKTVTVRPAGQVSNKLEITAGSITAGTTGAVTVKVTDQYGNPVAQSKDLVVTLKADSPTGKFFDKAESGTEISTVTIAKDKSEATVYYYDTKAGTRTITASAPGLDPDESTINVVPAEPAKIAVEADGSVVVNQKAKITFTVVDQFVNPVVVDGSPLTLVLSSSSATGRFEDENDKQITQLTIKEGKSSATAYYKDSTAGEVTITAKTTGLEGSANLTVQAVPAPDTTPPGEVTNLTVSPQPGAGVFGLSFTAPIDPDLAGVAVYAAVYGSNNWKQVEFENEVVYTCEPGGTARITVQVPSNLVLGKDRVQFKVVAVDTSGNESEGVVADNDGQGYLIVGCYELTPGPDGWRTFSVPVQLAGGQKLLGDVISLDAVEIAWKFDAASQRWVQVTEENNTIQPLEAVYVKLSGPALAVITPTSAATSPPVRELAAGWNLVGFTQEDGVSNALYPVRGKWSAAVSPAVNPEAWAVTPASTPAQNVLPHQGYWVYMDAPGTLAGFSSTPVTVGTYPGCGD